MKRGVEDELSDERLIAYHKIHEAIWLSENGAENTFVEKLKALLLFLEKSTLTSSDLSTVLKFEFDIKNVENNSEKTELTCSLMAPLLAFYRNLHRNEVDEEKRTLGENLLIFIQKHQLECKADLLMRFLTKDDILIEELKSPIEIENVNYLLRFRRKVFNTISVLAGLEHQCLLYSDDLTNAFESKLTELLDVLEHPEFTSENFKECVKTSHSSVIEKEGIIQHGVVYIVRKLSEWLISFCNLCKNDQLNHRIISLFIGHQLSFQGGWGSQIFIGLNNQKPEFSHSMRIELSDKRYLSFFEQVPAEKLLDLCKKEVERIYALHMDTKFLLIQNIVQRIPAHHRVDFLHLRRPNDISNHTLLWNVLHIADYDEKLSDQLVQDVFKGDEAEHLDLESTPFPYLPSVRKIICKTTWGKQWCCDLSRRKFASHLAKIQALIGENLKEENVIDLGALLEEAETLADEAFLMDNLDAYHLLAKEYERIGDVNHFKRVLMKTSVDNPYYVDPYFAAAVLCEKIDDAENLALILKEMGNNHTHYAQVAVLLAKIYARKEKIEALKQIVETLQVDTALHSEVCLMVADCLQKKAAVQQVDSIQSPENFRQDCLIQALHYTFLAGKEGEKLRPLIGFNYTYGNVEGNAKVGSLSQKIEKEPLLANFNLPEEQQYLLCLNLLKNKKMLKKENKTLKAENAKLKIELESARNKPV